MISSSEHSVFVVGGALVVVAGLVLQGIYTLRTGLLLAFFLRPSRAAALPLKLLHRVALAGLDLASAAAILAALSKLAQRHHVRLDVLAGWMGSHAGALVVSCLSVGTGLWLVLCPATMVGWLQEYHPGIAAGGSAMVSLILRFCGALAVACGLLILLSYLR
jgi:hypothetical protein